MTYVVGVPDGAGPRLLTGPPLWPNSLLEPTYEKLDRVHIDTDKFPLVTSLEYIEAVSDHAPILVIIGPRSVNSNSSSNLVGYIVRASHNWFKKVWKRQATTGQNPIQR
jgi:hypothetical protein